MKNPDRVKQGKKNAIHGAEFEKRVRKDLEEKGWVVDRCTNNVEFEDAEYKNEKLPNWFGRIVPAKPHMTFNPIAKMMIPLKRNTGFPDFVCHRKVQCSLCYARMGESDGEYYEVVGVECKINGKLDREEKEKCQWLLDNKIFSRLYIAEKTKVKNRIVIVYNEFKGGGK